MKLASIISKYFDTVSISGMAGDEFAYDLFSKLTETEINQVVDMLLDDPGISTEHVIISCVEAMIENNFMGMLDTYKQLGFGK